MIVKKIRGVSIIIPSWNGRGLLRQALPPLEEATQKLRTPVEIIVVDDGSQDGSPAYLKENFPKVRVVRHKKNLGFGESCNDGVREAKYNLVYLLNNDMIVDGNFLPPLIKYFEKEKDLFAVTSQVFFTDPKKRREESDKTYIRFKKGFFTVAHDVEDCGYFSPSLYGGGGSTLYDKEKFLKLGGFSHLYKPFYAEDLDLGYRAWKRGWKTLYDPRSFVLHKHRGTIGKLKIDREAIVGKNWLLFYWRNISDPKLWLSHFGFFLVNLALGRIRLKSFFWALRQLPQVIQERREDKQKPSLSDREVEKVSSSLFWYKEKYFPPKDFRKLKRLNILYVSPYVPYPPTHGGAVRMYNLIKTLSNYHNIYLLSFANNQEERTLCRRGVAKFCKEVSFVQKPQEKRPALFSIWPHRFSDFISEQMGEAIEKGLSRYEIDVLHLEDTQLAGYYVKSSRLKTVLAEQDISFVSFYRQYKNEANFLEKIRRYLSWVEVLNFELEEIKHFDGVVAMSENDAKILKKFIPDKVVGVVPNGCDIRYFKPSSGVRKEKKTLIFLGYFSHPPNVEGLNFFVENIYPLIKKRVKDLKLYIIGKNPPPKVSRLGRKRDIFVTGFVRDLRPYYQKGTAFIAPILSGSGTRVKIVEAMSAGIPVVSTEVGAEGLEVKNGKNILLAKTGEEFAEKVVGLLRDEELQKNLARRARETAERYYSWDYLAKKHNQFYQDLLKSR